jgi:hypothetical protein
MVTSVSQELAMSRSFAQVSLLALTVGFAAFGSSLTPAAALTSMHPGGIRLPSAATGPGASMHPISDKIHLPQVATATGASKYPVGAKIHVVSGVENAPGASVYPGGAKAVPGVQNAPGASTYPGAKTHVISSVQNVPGNSIYGNSTGTGQGGTGPGGGPSQGGTGPDGGPSQGGTGVGPGGVGPKPSGQIYPPGGIGRVVVVAPPAVYQAPVHVFTDAATAPVYQAARPNVATANTAPCNCLTKQYLDDGSVLFQDICTKETALATPDQLRAQVPTVAPTVR